MIPRSVRASRTERTRPLPGDDLIPEPIASLTHAITIRRSPRDVWPWLVQMGAGNRAGWYSYDFIDNDRHRSADRIVPDLQTIAVGALFPAAPGMVDGFHVVDFDYARCLVLGWRTRTERRADRDVGIVLEERPNGNTRLIVRAREDGVILSTVFRRGSGCRSSGSDTRSWNADNCSASPRPGVPPPPPPSPLTGTAGYCWSTAA